MKARNYHKLMPVIAAATLCAQHRGTAGAAMQNPLLRIPEEIWLAVTDNCPYDDFSQSRRDFINHKLADSATSLRRAAAYLKGEACRAEDRAAAALTTSAANLDQLADGVAAATVRSVAPLDHAFAHAHRALADHFMALARDTDQNDPSLRTGNYLRAALRNLEAAAIRTAGELQNEERVTIERGHEAADKLEATSQWNGSEATGVVEREQKAIDSLGQRLQETMARLIAVETGATGTPAGVQAHRA